MKKASKKKSVARNKANNDVRRVAGKPPDGRTKAGRAWKAAQAERARRARNREADKAAAKAAVTGSWVDLKDHPGQVQLVDGAVPREAPNFIEQSKNAQAALDKLKSTGMYWELFPEGHEKPRLITDAVGTTGGKATVAYWRVGV